MWFVTISIPVVNARGLLELHECSSDGPDLSRVLQWCFDRANVSAKAALEKGVIITLLWSEQ